MTLSDLRTTLAALPFFAQVREETKGLAPSQSLRIKGTAGSLPAFVLADVLEQTGGPIVALLAESESADYLRSDLERISWLQPTSSPSMDPELSFFMGGGQDKSREGVNFR